MKSNKFNFELVEDFDKHIKLSIPNFEGIDNIFGCINKEYAQPESIVLDLGCSTGRYLNSLEKINKISGNSFVWDEEKQNTYKGKDYGVIAQEIEEILPEVVATRPNGTKAVKYDKLTPLLIQAIKELKTELDELKSSRI